MPDAHPMVEGLRQDTCAYGTTAGESPCEAIAYGRKGETGSVEAGLLHLHCSISDWTMEAAGECGVQEVQEVDHSRMVQAAKEVLAYERSCEDVAHLDAKDVG